MKNKIILFDNLDVPLKKFFEDRGASVTVDRSQHFDLVVFTPGVDVSPFLYGETNHYKTQTNFASDLRSLSLYKNISLNTPKIGVGRGAQFLNVMAGGKLYQYMNGHLSKHLALDVLTGNYQLILSNHKQGIIPTTTMDLLLIAGVSDKKETSTQSINIDTNTQNKMEDVECCFDERTTSLMFQPRLTLFDDKVATKNTIELFYSYVDDYILPKISGLKKVYA